MDASDFWQKHQTVYEKYASASKPEHVVAEYNVAAMKESIEARYINPPNSGFLMVKLDQVIIDYLWELIDKAKDSAIDHKKNLVGNISKSLLLKDENSYFLQTVCGPLVEAFRQRNPDGGDPTPINTLEHHKAKLAMDALWVNYQYETEFNPTHFHKGVCSFTIWMKIPYKWED